MSKILTAMLAAGFCLGLNVASAENCPSDQSADQSTNMPGTTQADLVAPDGRYQAGSGYTSLEQEVIVLLVSEDQTASAEEESPPANSSE